jgi:RNA polymerase sigma-70 factor (ECF subfamily)
MKQSSLSDLAEKGYLDRAIQGDTKAYGVLYTHYLEEIHRYIYYRVINQAEAEDLTETVFIKAWDALPRFESSKVNLRAWLYRIAHNTVIDFYRTKRSTVELSSQQHDRQPSLEHQIQTLEDNRGLALAIQTLDEKLQQVVLCRFVNGLSHAETAEIMGLKEGHVRVLQLRALQKLRLVLEKQYE